MRSRGLLLCTAAHSCRCCARLTMFFFRPTARLCLTRRVARSIRVPSDIPHLHRLDLSIRFCFQHMRSQAVNPPVVVVPDIGQGLAGLQRDFRSVNPRNRPAEVFCAVPCSRWIVFTNKVASPPEAPAPQSCHNESEFLWRTGLKWWN